MPQGALDQGYPGSVEDFQNFITLRALFVRKATESFPPEARYRWVFDGAWQLEQAERYLPRLMGDIRRLVNSGEFAYNPVYAHLHSMYLSHEQLMRMMSYARDLEQKDFRRSYTALHADVPTVSWGYASALASAGVKYLLKGTWYNSPYSRNLAQVAPAPLFRWVGPDGRKVLLFYYDGYAAMPQGAGLGRPYESMTEEAIEGCVAKYEKLASAGKWPYDAFPLFGSEGDWGVPDRRNSDFFRHGNKSHPAVQLRMSTPAAVRFASSFQRGLLPMVLTSRNGSLPAAACFVEIDSDEVIVSTLKKANDGRGILMRLWNPSDAARTTKVAFPGRRIASATATDVLERDLNQDYEVRDQAVTVPCGVKQFVTLRIVGDRPYQDPMEKRP